MCVLFTFYESEYTLRFSKMFSVPPILPVLICKVTRQQAMPILDFSEHRVTSLQANQLVTFGLSSQYMTRHPITEARRKRDFPNYKKTSSHGPCILHVYIAL